MTFLRDTEASNTVEDDKFGPDGRYDDLGAEMARGESRLAKIRRAKADLEADVARRVAADAARKTTASGSARLAAANHTGRVSALASSLVAWSWT